MFGLHAVPAFGSSGPRPPVDEHCVSFPAISLAELPSFTGCATLVSANGTYTGSFFDGKYSGAGSMVYAATNVDDKAVHPPLTSGDVYSGEWLAGVRHGPGILTRCGDKNACGIWQTVFAQWEVGAYRGSVVQVFKPDFCIRRLTGETRDSTAEGMLSSGFVMGTFVYADGSTYVGEMQDSASGIYLDGHGTLTSASGEIFSGIWASDTLQAQLDVNHGRALSKIAVEPTYNLGMDSVGMNSSDVLGCCTAAQGWCSY